MRSWHRRGAHFQTHRIKLTPNYTRRYTGIIRTHVMSRPPDLSCYLGIVHLIVKGIRGARGRVEFRSARYIGMRKFALGAWIRISIRRFLQRSSAARHRSRAGSEMRRKRYGGLCQSESAPHRPKFSHAWGDFVRDIPMPNRTDQTTLSRRGG